MCDLTSKWKMKLRKKNAKNWLRYSYLVHCLLTLFVLLGLLLHLLPLFYIVDESEEVTQVNDERLRLNEGIGWDAMRKWMQDRLAIDDV